jgi:ABC-type amino acid transport substrate-binding protein
LRQSFPRKGKKIIAMLRKPWIALVVALLTSLGRPALGGEPIRIGTWDVKSDPSVIVSTAVLKRAYQELNQPIEFVELPARRALTMLLDAQLDANVHRAAATFTSYPQLVQVTVPVSSVSIRGYVRKDSDLRIAQWSDTGGVIVTYPRGTLIIENKLPASSKHLAAGSVNEMFRMVSVGMADIALVVEPAGSPAHPLALSNSLMRIAIALDQTPVYHTLSSQQRELAERLNVVLEKLRGSGELKDIQKRALATSTD